MIRVESIIMVIGMLKRRFIMEPMAGFLEDESKGGWGGNKMNFMGCEM